MRVCSWLSSHLSLTLILNWGLNPLWHNGSVQGPQWFVSPRRVSDQKAQKGDDRPLAVALLIRFAKLRAENPHLPPSPRLIYKFLEYVFYPCVYVCVCLWLCVNAHPWMCTSATGRTLPFVGETICCGPPLSWYVWVLRGGWWVLRGRWRFRITQARVHHRLMSPSTPLRYFGFFCMFARERLGAEEHIYDSNSHTCVC